MRIKYIDIIEFGKLIIFQKRFEPFILDNKKQIIEDSTLLLIPLFKKKNKKKKEKDVSMIENNTCLIS